jgi:hypothetical protein
LNSSELLALLATQFLGRRSPWSDLRRSGAMNWIEPPARLAAGQGDSDW